MLNKHINRKSQSTDVNKKANEHIFLNAELNRVKILRWFAVLFWLHFYDDFVLQ